MSFIKEQQSWMKGKKHSLEAKDKMSRAQMGKKGHTAWNKGKKIVKMIGNTFGFKKGQVPWNKGIPMDEETKQKVSASKMGKIPWNKKFSNEVDKKAGKSFCQKKRELRKKSIGGSHTFQQWQDLKKQFNYMCLCCKKYEPEIKLTEDHIIPITKGGSDDLSNIQPLCFSCNSRKNVIIMNYIVSSIQIL